MTSENIEHRRIEEKVDALDKRLDDVETTLAVLVHQMKQVTETLGQIRASSERIIRHDEKLKMHDRFIWGLAGGLGLVLLYVAQQLLGGI